MQRRLCAAILTLEAIAFGLSTPVLISVEEVSTSAALGVGLGLTLACLLVAGLLRFPWAYWLGWAIQVGAVAVGLLLPTMFFLGGVFLALWATAWWLGRRIETDRARWQSGATEQPGR